MSPPFPPLPMPPPPPPPASLALLLANARSLDWDWDWDWDLIKEHSWDRGFTMVVGARTEGQSTDGGWDSAMVGESGVAV